MKIMFWVTGIGRLKECLEKGKVRGELVHLFEMVRDRTVCPKVFLQKI